MRTVLSLTLLIGFAAAETASPAEWLVIAPPDARGRRPFNPDRVFARYLLDRDAAPPREGDRVREQAWVRVAAGEKPSGRMAYAYATVECESARVVLASLRGASTLFVNGDAFVGDVYGSGTGGVPVPLRAGTNHLFARGGRGAFSLRFEEVAEGVHVSPRDATLPDLVAGGARRSRAAVVVYNASAAAQEAVVIEQDGRALLYRPGLVPFGVRKLALVTEGAALRVGGHAFELAVREPAAVRRVTYRSDVDGSVQFYAVVPPTGEGRDVLLSLHGAGVDAFRQARCYSPKPDFWQLAATNRRPFGFDWQDWGRRDAYEVLRAAGFAKRRVFLTGHSMGGHGTWHLAANDPDRFLAIAPSAGWSSFDSYGGRPAGALDALWRGADGASATLDLIGNLAALPAYVLHGSKDDNVPPSEARLMIEALEKAGAKPRSHFQEGAGHWWNGDASAGVDCVDWPGFFELFRAHREPRVPDALDFTTADPGIDADHFWLRVEQPLEYGRTAHVAARAVAERIEATTRNVRRLRIDRDVLECVLDGQSLTRPADGWFLREEGRWRAAAPVAGEKSPAHSGPFKRAFDRRFLLVYGSGDAEGLARARYDAQLWWYRGNGDAAIVTDEEFLARGFAGRNVILYGNADLNDAWDRVFGPDCPLRVKEGSVRIGAKTTHGGALAAVFVRPRRDDAGSLAGAFAYSGVRGARIGYGLLPFVSGVGYPDYALFSTEFLERGDAGVLEAGWFAHDWSMPRR